MSTKLTCDVGLQQPPAVASSVLLERALQPQIGDTYTRSDSRVTVKVVNVLKTYVAVEYTEDGKTDYAQHETELFCRLARKSIESGGRFEPARSNGEVSHRSGPVAT
jgi:hypothetical protein